MLIAVVCLTLGLVSPAATFDNSDALQLGTGIYDATGPISDVLLMGMANPSQKAAGLHQRLRSRAFVAYDSTNDKRIAFVSLDAGMGGIVLKNRVIAELNIRAPGMYSHDNVAISGTHTHSGPSGFLEDTIFQFAGSGWVPRTIDAFVTAVVESIWMAHTNLAPADGFLSVGELNDSNINRSPTAYLLNPEDERSQYDANTDLNMTVLKMVTKTGEEIGMFNWFAVHGTSMNNTNLLVSGDNKGYASYLVEQWKNGPTSEVKPGLGKFVAGFGATNLGDVSPNTAGPRCRDTGLPCDGFHSTCNGKAQQCSAFGPGKDMFQSTQIIGSNQAQKAMELYNSTGVALHGSVDFAHAYVTMPGTNVTDYKTGEYVGTLCKAAMGDAFAAGTTDGPGMFDFTQGNSSNPFFNFIASLLHKATPEEKACQKPKNILLSTGSIDIPYPWGPDVLPVQILKVGQLVILSVPTELTTMAGRRMRNQLRKVLIENKVVGDDAIVVIAGLSNGYADYTTTFEEFQQQRYEGGSTIFGPHQLNGYIQELSKLAVAMGAGVKPATGPAPNDFSDKFHNNPNVSTDYLPSGAKHFGQVMSDVADTYVAGTGIATVSYAGANPLNDLQLQDSFVEVIRCNNANCSEFTLIAVDGDWETRIKIKKSTVDVIESARTWTVEWHIPDTTPPGNYAIFFRGSSCDDPTIGKIKFTPFAGISRIFSVTSPK